MSMTLAYYSRSVPYHYDFSDPLSTVSGASTPGFAGLPRSFNEGRKFGILAPYVHQ